MLFLAPTLDNADPLFTLVITSGFYPQNVEVTDQEKLVRAYKQTSQFYNLPSIIYKQESVTSTVGLSKKHAPQKFHLGEFVWLRDNKRVRPTPEIMGLSL